MKGRSAPEQKNSGLENADNVGSESAGAAVGATRSRRQ